MDAVYFGDILKQLNLALLFLEHGFLIWQLGLDSIIFPCGERQGSVAMVTRMCMSVCMCLVMWWYKCFWGMFAHGSPFSFPTTSSKIGDNQFTDKFVCVRERLSSITGATR